MFSEQLENWDCHQDNDTKKSSTLKKKSIQISNLFSLKRNRHTNTSDSDKHQSQSQSTIDTTDTENSFNNSSFNNNYYYHDNDVSDSTNNDLPADDVVVAETTTTPTENTIDATTTTITNENNKGRKGVGTTLVYAAGMVVRVAGYAAGAALNVSNVGEAVSAIVDVCEAVAIDPNSTTGTANNSNTYPTVDKEFYANSLANFQQTVQAHEQRMRELNINDPTSLSLSSSLNNERTVPLSDSERKELIRKNFEAALKSYQEMNLAMQHNPKF